MRAVITVEMDNAAFQEYPWDELSRIISELAARLERSGFDGDVKLRDINGNTVGEFKIEGE